MFFVIPERLASIRSVVLVFTVNKQTKQTNKHSQLYYIDNGFNYNGNDISAFMDTLLVACRTTQMASRARLQVALCILLISYSTPICHFSFTLLLEWHFARTQKSFTDTDTTSSIDQTLNQLALSSLSMQALFYTKKTKFCLPQRIPLMNIYT